MTRDDYLEVGRAANGDMLIRTRILHLLAKAFGLQIKIGGRPYGARYDCAINHTVSCGNLCSEITDDAGHAIISSATMQSAARPMTEDDRARVQAAIQRSVSYPRAVGLAKREKPKARTIGFHRPK